MALPTTHVKIAARLLSRWRVVPGAVSCGADYRCVRQKTACLASFGDIPNETNDF